MCVGVNRSIGLWLYWLYRRSLFLPAGDVRHHLFQASSVSNCYSFFFSLWGGLGNISLLVHIHNLLSYGTVDTAGFWAQTALHPWPKNNPPLSTSTQRTVSGAAGQPGPVVLSLLRASNVLNDVPFADLQTCDQVLSRIYNAWFLNSEWNCTVVTCSFICCII